jgi:hypothetical protein
MNNTFNINRFALLLRRQWLEFGKIFLITLGVAFGVIATFYLVSFWPVFLDSSVPYVRVGFREPLFVIFGFLFITVVASSYFAHLGQKPKTIIELLLPASTFEKFLAGVFFTAILSVLGYILVFYLTDLALMTKLRNIPTGADTERYYLQTIDGKDISVDRYVYVFDVLKNNMFLPFYMAPLFVTSVFLLGSVYFDKFHYIKTAIAVMLFSGIAGYVFAKAAEFLMSNRRPIGMPGFIIGRGTHTVELIITLVVLLLTVVFWAITYVRLKEKEV